MPKLTAKVFRTYNASFTMSNKLQELKIPANTSIAEKIKMYNDCNRDVAILCNHKRTVGASHEAQMEKLGDRVKGLRYQQWRTKMMMVALEPKIKKRRGAEFFELPAELDQEWIEQHQAFLVEEQRTKITKKFEKENEKLVAEKQEGRAGRKVAQRGEARKRHSQAGRTHPHAGAAVGRPRGQQGGCPRDFKDRKKRAAARFRVGRGH